MRKGVLIFWLVASASIAFAQGGHMLPPGKWWRQERLVQQLGLTEEQKSRLDEVFQNSAAELIDLKAEVEKRGLTLRHEMDQAQTSRQEIQRAAASLSQARARLFERELMMFLDMRSVLSQEQWSRMRSLLASRAEMRRDHRRGIRPGAQGRRPGARPRPPN